ncbi:MAG: hypothetical protein K8U03_13430 [Planctomycetia bacterium]|nr:hypothetical protein [Planctomycetia bacterium]
MDWLLPFFIGLAVIAAIGHGIWVLCAAILRALFTGSSNEPTAAPFPATPKYPDQCPECTKPFPGPRARCDVCGWPKQTPQPEEKKRLALESLRRRALDFRRKEWLDPESFHLIIRSLDESLHPIVVAQEVVAQEITKPVADVGASPMAPPPAETIPLASVDEVAPAAPPVVPELTPAPPIATPPVPDKPSEPTHSTYDVAEVTARRAAAFAASMFPPPRKAEAPSSPAASALASAPAAPPPPAVPHKPFSKIFASFLEEKNIRWGELIGGLLIICSSIALVLSFWQPISERPLLKFGLFNGVTAALFGIGLYVERRWRLPTTTHGILLIAVLLVPLNFLAIAAFTLETPPTDALAIGGELLSIALFAWLTVAAGKILVGPAGWHLAAGVVGSSALELIVRRFAVAESSTELLLALGLPPVLCFALPTAIWARRLDRTAEATSTFGEAEANQLFKIAGTTLFAALLPICILLAKTGHVATTLTRIAPLVSLFGAPLLAVGLVLWRRLTVPDLMKERVAGTAVATAGAMAMIAAVALGWPMPAGMFPTAVINAIVFTWVAVRCGIPAAHLPAALCLAAAYLLGFHVVRGGVAWYGDDPHATLGVLLSAISGTALVVPAVLFALPALLFVARRSDAESMPRAFAKWYAAAGGLTAVVSTALVGYFAFGVLNDDAYATWVFAVYSVGMIAAATITGRQSLGYLGSALGWAALVQGICFRYIGSWSHAEAWSYALLAHATISLIAMRWIAGRGGIVRSGAALSPQAYQGAATPLFVGAVWTSAFAVPSLMLMAYTGQTLPAAIGFAWLTAVWGFIAWWVASPVSFAFFQAAGFVAAIEGSHFALQRQTWFDELTGYPRILDPRTLAVYGMTAAGLCGIWLGLRLLRRTAARLVNASEVTVDRVVLCGSIGLVVALAFAALLPGVCQELSPQNSASSAHGNVPPLAQFELFGIPHASAYGQHVWLFTALVGAVVGLGMWERFARRKLLALVIVSVAASMLIAARWETETAAASALRWSGVLLFGLLSSPLWFRGPTLAVVGRCRWPKWNTRGPSLVRFLFGWSLGLSLLPSVLATSFMVWSALERRHATFDLSAALVAAIIFVFIGLALSVQLTAIRRPFDGAAERVAGRSWSLLGARLLVLSGMAPLAAIVVSVLFEALQASPIVGPDPASWFVRIGVVNSYVLPLLLLALAFLLHALTRRSAGIAFAAALVLNLGATVGYLLMHAPTGLPLDDALWFRLAHLNASVSALFALAWTFFILARRKGSTDEAGAASWLTTQTALAAAIFAPAIVGPVAQLFADLYGPASMPNIVADRWAWGAFALVLAAAGLWFRAAREPISVAAWSLSALGVVSLGALATIPHLTGDLEAFDFLVGGWIFVAFALVAGGIWAERRSLPFGPPRAVIHWATFVGTAAFLAAQFGLISIALHQIARSTSPAPHAFLLSMAFLFSVLCILLAAWGASRARLYVAAFALTFGVMTVWVEGLGQRLFPGGSDWIAACVQLISWSLPTPLWLFIERRFIIPRIGVDRRSWLGVLSRTTGVLTLLALIFLAWIGLADDLDGAPLEIDSLLYGAATVSVLIAVATSLWDAGAKYSVFALYAAGLTTVGVALDAFDLDARTLFWTGTMFTSAYALGTSYLWSRRAGLRVLAAKLRMPLEKWNATGGATTDDESLAGQGWMVAANYGLSLLVVFAAYRVILTFDSFASRFGAAQAVFGVAVAVALLARGSRRSSLQIRALELGLLGAIAVGWAILEPGMSGEFLNRAVLAVTSTSLVIALYGLGFSKLLRRENEWTAAAQRLVPRLIVLAASGLALVLAAEVYETTEYGHVEIGPTAIGAVVVALVGLVVAAITAALIPGRDPLGLSERGRMGYVYGAEVILALLFLHVRLSMPWLFTGFMLRYWPVAVMVLAFAGVGLAEVFRRRKQTVLAEPLERTGAFLPLLPVFGFWATQTEVHYSLLLLAVGLLYSTLAVMRKSFGFGILAALAANGGLWYFLGNQEGLGWLEHPQIWIIPPALCVLIASHLNRSRLKEEQISAYRYGSAATIYVASTADVFLNGVAEAPLLPLWLAGLAIVGIFAGIALRVRAFLFLGTAFLLLALMTIIWHAAYDLEQTWIFYVVGIVAGVSIIALFAVFEKKRHEILGIVEKLREWDA